MSLSLVRSLALFFRQALVINVEPDGKVKAAMNKVETARKERAAAGIPLPTALAEEIASLGEAKGIAVDFAALADTEKEQEDDQTPPAKPFLGGLGAVLPPLLLLGGLYLMRVRAENR